jgi:hypothetical protein
LAWLSTKVRFLDFPNPNIKWRESQAEIELSVIHDEERDEDHEHKTQREKITLFISQNDQIKAQGAPHRPRIKQNGEEKQQKDKGWVKAAAVGRRSSCRTP